MRNANIQYRLAENQNNKEQQLDEEESTIKARIKDKEREKETLHREVEQLREQRKEAEKAREKERLEQEERKRRNEQNKIEEQKRAEEEQIRKRNDELKKEEMSKRAYVSIETLFLFVFLHRRNIQFFSLEQMRPNTVIQNKALTTQKLRDVEYSSSGFGLASKMNRSHSTPDLAQVCSSMILSTCQNYYSRFLFILQSGCRERIGTRSENTQSGS